MPGGYKSQQKIIVCNRLSFFMGHDEERGAASSVFSYQWLDLILIIYERFLLMNGLVHHRSHFGSRYHTRADAVTQAFWPASIPRETQFWKNVKGDAVLCEFLSKGRRSTRNSAQLNQRLVFWSWICRFWKTTLTWEGSRPPVIRVEGGQWSVCALIMSCWPRWWLALTKWALHKGSSA